MYYYGSLIIVVDCFFVDNAMARSIITSKLFWAHCAICIFSIVIFFVLLVWHEIEFKFSIADGLIIAFVVITSITYDWGLNLEPDKISYGGQVVVLWFMIRIVVRNFSLRFVVMFLIIATGTAEAIIGMRQLYGFEASRHALFGMTGTFYNPGPYSGWLAICVSVAVGTLLELNIKQQNKNLLKGELYKWNKIVHIILQWFSILSISAMAVVLPASMGRTSWIAVATSCAIVYLACYHDKIKNSLSVRMRIGIIVLSSIAVISCFCGIYQIKRDSASGRFLMWKIEARAMMKKPQGAGFGSFPKSYADMQVEYFSSDEATERERFVAGCPEYAFNEYLQIGIETGIVGMLVFIALLVFCIIKGLKNKFYASAGGLTALAVFAFAGYPLQLPEFWILMIIIAGYSIEDRVNETVKKRKGEVERFLIIFTCLIFLIISVILSLKQMNHREAYLKWNKVRMMYKSKNDDAVVNEYIKLYPMLNHQTGFLFEGAYCLNKIEHYNEAIEWLRRAEQTSCDAIILEVRAKNEQQIGNFIRAEHDLLRAINLQPERIYPYYLLVKLYSDSSFYNQEKMMIAADIVLKKNPKVESTAIQEMRDEVKRLLREHNLYPKSITK